MSFTNRVYDVLKWIAQYLLPALGTLYFALSKLWGLPYGEEVVGTISAIDIFLGTLLGISSISYKGDGTIKLSEDNDGGDEIELYSEIGDVVNRGRITLNVEK